MTQRIGFVTGASRGIGAACAVALAQKGFDVAISARTVREGEGRSPTTFINPAEPLALSGSLETTAQRIEAVKRSALLVPLDLVERKSIQPAVERVVKHFGRIDVFVNCGIYKGPGDQDPFLETPIELMERVFEADVISQIVLLKHVVAQMLAQGGGTVINISSSVVFREPPGPIGHGGWGFAYGLAKGAFSRVPGLLNAELGKRGITAYNLEPGFVRSDVGPEAASFPGVPATPPEAIGASVAWLATEPEARKFINKMVHGPELCKSKGLLEANDSQ